MQSVTYILMVIAMFIKANFHKFTAALLSLAIVIVCIMLLIFSKECADGAFSGAAPRAGKHAFAGDSSLVSWFCPPDGLRRASFIL